MKFCECGFILMQPSFLNECSSYLSYWKILSEDEKEEYVHICDTFKNEEKKTSKDKRIISFPNELSKIVSYIERSEFNKEARCILVGICFCGPILCLNNRQLKFLTCRCKSSINGSFQKLGYVSILCKSKSRDCVTTALPSLKSHPTILRQWSSRFISNSTLICFVPSIINVQMPEILPEDVHEEKRKPRTQKRFVFNSMLSNYLQNSNNDAEIINTDDMQWKTEQITDDLSPMYSLEYENNISTFSNSQCEDEWCDDVFNCYPTDDSYKLEFSFPEWNPIVE